MAADGPGGLLGVGSLALALRLITKVRCAIKRDSLADFGDFEAVDVLAESPDWACRPLEQKVITFLLYSFIMMQIKERGRY